MPEALCQLAIIRLDDFGPWTLRLGSFREPRVQLTLARIYMKAQRLLSSRGGLVLANRLDELVAITSGIPVRVQRALHRALGSGLPFSVSWGVGTGPTPAKALEEASRALRERGPTRGGERNRFAHRGAEDGNGIALLHVDIKGITERLVDRVDSAYETTLHVNRFLLTLAERFLPLGGLTFYLGGDNYLVLLGEVEKGEVKEALQGAAFEAGLELRAGLGRGRDAREAMAEATRRLDEARRLGGEGPVTLL